MMLGHLFIHLFTQPSYHASLKCIQCPQCARYCAEYWRYRWKCRVLLKYPGRAVLATYCYITNDSPSVFFISQSFCGSGIRGWLFLGGSAQAFLRLPLQCPLEAWLGLGHRLQGGAPTRLLVGGLSSPPVGLSIRLLEGPHNRAARFFQSRWSKSEGRVDSQHSLCPSLRSHPLPPLPHSGPRRWISSAGPHRGEGESGIWDLSENCRPI